jgi:hypothetical protein
MNTVGGDFSTPGDQQGLRKWPIIDTSNAPQMSMKIAATSDPERQNQRRW